MQAITSCKIYDSSLVGHICRFNIWGGQPAAIRTTGSHASYQLAPTETTNEKRRLVRIESYQKKFSKCCSLNRHWRLVRGRLRLVAVQLIFYVENFFENTSKVHTKPDNQHLIPFIQLTFSIAMNLGRLPFNIYLGCLSTWNRSTFADCSSNFHFDSVVQVHGEDGSSNGSDGVAHHDNAPKISCLHDSQR